MSPPLRRGLRHVSWPDGKSFAFTIFDDPDAQSPDTLRFRQDAEAIRSIRPSIAEWMETAKNYALYGNDSGAYDELAAFLKRRRG